MATKMKAAVRLTCPACGMEIVVPKGTAGARQPLEHLGEDHHRVVYKSPVRHLDEDRLMTRV